MSMSIYEATAPQYEQILGAMIGLLDKAEAHCRELKLAESDLTGCKLAEDMLPFTFQIGASVMFSAGTLAKLKGETYPRAENLESFAACRAAIAAALDYVKSVKAADVDGAADREVVFQTPRGNMHFIGKDYVFSFALPNFYFHATTAYDILRHRGLVIGKSDFMGAVRMKSFEAA